MTSYVWLAVKRDTSYHKQAGRLQKLAHYYQLIVGRQGDCVGHNLGFDNGQRQSHNLLAGFQMTDAKGS